MVGGMDIQKLQEGLVEKILLIPTEYDDRSNLERALEIINKLGIDHINDIITIGYGRFAALDYVIIADSQGSTRSRINNVMLVELENVIRNVEGRTPEELGLVQTEASTHREIPINVNIANRDEATPLHYAIQNGHLDIVRLLLERGANVNVAAPLDSIISRSDDQEARSSVLENVTVQSNMEGRENSL